MPKIEAIRLDELVDSNLMVRKLDEIDAVDVIHRFDSHACHDMIGRVDGKDGNIQSTAIPHNRLVNLQNDLENDP